MASVFKLLPVLTILVGLNSCMSAFHSKEVWAKEVWARDVGFRQSPHFLKVQIEWGANASEDRFIFSVAEVQNHSFSLPLHRKSLTRVVLNDQIHSSWEALAEDLVFASEAEIEEARILFSEMEAMLQGSFVSEFSIDRYLGTVMEMIENLDPDGAASPEDILQFRAELTTGR